MKKEGILNPEIVSIIAALGHGDFLVIADAGLPFPNDLPCIDISLIKGIPSFADTLQAISRELAIESWICAEELPEKNPEIWKKMQTILPQLPYQQISHELFKKQTALAKALIRTGEASPYANIILVAGVTF